MPLCHCGTMLDMATALTNDLGVIERSIRRRAVIPRGEQIPRQCRVRADPAEPSSAQAAAPTRGSGRGLAKLPSATGRPPLSSNPRLPAPDSSRSPRHRAGHCRYDDGNSASTARRGDCRAGQDPRRAGSRSVRSTARGRSPGDHRAEAHGRDCPQCPPLPAMSPRRVAWRGGGSDGGGRLVVVGARLHSAEVHLRVAGLA